MKELIRHYRPRDTRGDKPGVGEQKKLRDGGMAEEFAALFAMRDQITPDMSAENEKGQEPLEVAIEKGGDKGIER